jgi:hypothetical protein
MSVLIASILSIEKPSAVIPGRREAAGPESRKTGNSDVSGFRARAFGAPRNDVLEFFSTLLALLQSVTCPAGIERP